jgi:hypothetical protein
MKKEKPHDPNPRNHLYKNGRFIDPPHLNSPMIELPTTKHYTAPLTPKTELEQQIAKKLNWDGYAMQFPKYYRVHTLKRPVIGENGKWTTGVYCDEFHPSCLPPVEELKINLSDKKFKQHIRSKLDALHLPKDFKKHFPYLYGVLYDQVVGREVELLKKEHYFSLASAYRQMTQQLLTTIIEVFDMIMNRMVVEVPELQQYFERHPEDLALLQFVKTMITPFVSKELAAKEKVLLVPDPEDGLLQNALKERKLLSE